MNEKIEDLLEKIKTVFSPLKDKIAEIYDENKKLFFVFAGLIFVILICVFLLIFMPKENQEEKKRKIPYPQEKSELSEKPLIPGGPELPKDYTYSRQTKEKWSKEDAEIWFTVPSQKEIDSLSKSNDNMINEIIGAAP